MTADTDALTATRLLVEQGLPGLVVLDAAGLPLVILPASQVLRFALPDYIEEDPMLARVIPEIEADQLCSTLSGQTVAQLMPDRAYLPHRDSDRPIVAPDATAIQIASVMSRQKSPIVAVTEKGRTGVRSDHCPPAARRRNHVADRRRYCGERILQRRDGRRLGCLCCCSG